MPGQSAFPYVVIELGLREAGDVLGLTADEVNAAIHASREREPTRVEWLLGQAVIALGDRIAAAEGRPPG